MSSRLTGHAAALPGPVVTRLIPLAPGALTPRPRPPAADDPAQGVLAWDEPNPQATTEEAAAGVRAVPPDPRDWSTRFAQAVVEVVAGHRHSAQLVRWTTPGVYRDLERRARLAQRAATASGGLPVQRSTLRPQVCSVHVCRVGLDIAEVSVRVKHGRRSRALAIRLDAVGGRWTCSALEFA